MTELCFRGEKIWWPQGWESRRDWGTNKLIMEGRGGWDAWDGGSGRRWGRDTGEAAAGLSDGCPRGCPQGIKGCVGKRGSMFLLVSRLNYVADEDAIRGKGANVMGKMNQASDLWGYFTCRMWTWKCTGQLKTQIRNPEKRSGPPERRILVWIKLHLCRGAISTYSVFE